MTALTFTPSAAPTIRVVPAGASAPQQLAAPTLWGYTLPGLHDLLWKSQGMQVVRPGQTQEIDANSDLFLLAVGREVLRLDMQAVLDRLYWTPQDVILLGLNSKATAAPVRAPWLPPIRFALTGNPAVAHYWKDRPPLQAAHAMALLWRGLRQRWPAHVAMRLRGRAYQLSGDDLHTFTAGLVGDFSDPDTLIPGIERLGHGAWGPRGCAHMKVRPPCQPLWIGHGWDTARLAAPANEHVLFDVTPKAPSTNPLPGTTL